jgi:hypothetical protein
MPQKSSYLSKSFLIWVVAIFLGISGTAAISLLFTFQLISIKLGLISVFIFTVPIGLAQWLALRRVSRTSILWVFTFTVGFLLFILVNRLIPDGWRQTVGDESFTLLTAEFIMIGFMVGLLQWFILRRQFSGSSLWLLGSSAGIGFSFWLILTTNLINQSGIASIVVGVLLYAIIAGLILIRLLNHPYQILKLEEISITDKYSSLMD